MKTLRLACLAVFFLEAVVFFGSGEVLAEDSPLNLVLGRSSAVVSLHSINATVFTNKPQGFFDKTHGVVYLVNRICPMAYERNGSGVIIDPKGVLVAAAHTVMGAGAVAITLFDGTQIPCKKILIVPNTDIAFLAFDPPFALSAVPFSDSKMIAVGESVYTFGNSQWIKGSLLGGKIVGIKQDLFDNVVRSTLLQVSFSVYRGDSGSPLFDRRGRLLGIVNAGQEGRENATFAISAEIVEWAYRKYVESLEN